METGKNVISKSFFEVIARKGFIFITTSEALPAAVQFCLSGRGLAGTLLPAVNDRRL